MWKILKYFLKKRLSEYEKQSLVEHTKRYYEVQKSYNWLIFVILRFNFFYSYKNLCFCQQLSDIGFSGNYKKLWMGWVPDCSKWTQSIRSYFRLKKIRGFSSKCRSFFVVFGVSWVDQVDSHSSMCENVRIFNFFWKM